MRPTGALHLRHFHGAADKLGEAAERAPLPVFSSPDWHRLTTHYETPDVIEGRTSGTCDRLAGRRQSTRRRRRCSSSRACLSHAELHTLLSMITPLGWLERVPSYKDNSHLTDRT